MRMEKIFTFWDLMLIPSITRFYKNDYISAIRRSFYILMPFWLTISFFDILGNVFLNPTGILFDKNGLNLGFRLTGLSGEEFLQSNLATIILAYKNVVSVGYNIIAMILTVTLAARLSEIWHSDKILTIFCSISVFLIQFNLISQKPAEVANYFSEVSFFSAFAVTFCSARIFSWLCNIKKLLIKVPKFFPAEMVKYLSAVIPVMLTLTIFTTVFFLVYLALFQGNNFLLKVSDWTIFQNPIFVCIYQFFIWSLSWLGIPGYAMTSAIIEVAYMPAQLQNQIGESSAIFTTGFFEAGVIHVLGLMIAILVFSQNDGWRSITKFSLPLMFFNIQEVFIFGLPVILNPLFLLPYIFAPVANCLVGWFAISWGIVPIFQTDIPWTMLLLLGPIASTHSIMGGLLQIVWLIMDIFIYAPFVITANSLELDEKKVGDKN